MPILYVPIGISGCGKSTFVKDLGVDVVSSDDIRKELFDDEGCQDNPGMVFEVAHNRIRALLKSGKDAVFDATNVAKWTRDELMKFVPSDVTKICILFLIEPTEALRRQENRDRKVPEDVVIRQWNTMLGDIGTLSEEFDKIVIV